MFTRVTPPLRCRGRPEAIARERAGIGLSAKSGGDRARCGRDSPPAAARRRGRSRVEVVPQTLRAYAVGGGRLRISGDGGFWGLQQHGDQGRQVEAALAGGAHDTGEDLLGVGAVAGAVAAAHLADDHGGPDGLFGAPVGGVERGVPQEEEHGWELVGQVRREALGVIERRRGVDQPTEAGGESAAGRGRPVLAEFSRVAAVAQVEAGLQDRLHLAGPGTVGMVLLKLLMGLPRSRGRVNACGFTS